MSSLHLKYDSLASLCRAARQHRASVQSSFSPITCVWVLTYEVASVFQSVTYSPDLVDLPDFVICPQ